MILAIGTVAIDSIKTPIATKKDVLGGSVVYFSVPASVNAPVRLIGVVGEDFPKKHLTYLKSKNIDISGIAISKEPTFRWDGHYLNDLNMAHTNNTILGALASFNPVLTVEQANAPFVFLGNIDPDIQINILKQLKQPKLIALDSMNYWIESKRTSLLKAIQKVDILFLNEAEIRQLAQESSTLKATKAIQKKGPKTIIVKRGEYGSLMVSSDFSFSSMVFPTEKIKDPTGAGDSFAGGVLSYLYTQMIINKSKKPYSDLLKQAIVWGSATASFTIEDFSINGFTNITKEDILERANHIYNTSSFIKL